MVEQIRISPEEVRGYGNVCEEHSLDDFIVSSSGLAKEKETVHGTLTDVYKLVYSLYGLMFDFDRGNKQLYLQMGEADILSFGFDDDSKQLYLLDMARTGLSLGFDEDTNELYISDAPPIVHNYSLAFSAASYVATGGSAILECTLLDNNVPVSGASVTVTGSDSSSYTGITNSNGIASVTVTGITTQTTFTCSYGGVTDNCTVNVPTYLFYDECSSATGLSNYGQIRPISSSTTTSYLEYDSNNNAYYVHANGDWGVIPITALNGLDNYKITAEFKTKSSGNTYQGGIGFIAENGTNNIIFRMYGSSCNSVINDGSQQNIGSVSASSKWYRFEVTKQGTSFSVTVTDLSNDTVVGTQTRTTSFGTYYVGFMTVAGQSYGSYVRNVKAESL